MGKKNISAVISLKDNMSASLRGIRREQKAFQKELRVARQELKKTQAEARKKMQARMDATQAHKTISKLRKSIAPLRKKVVATIIAKESAMAKINKVKSGLKSVGGFIAKPFITAKDKATSIISTIGGKLGMLAKGIAIPLTVVTAGAGMAVKEGMMLEQQQVSMKHFMGVGNKDKKDGEVQKMTDTYLKDLRNNANATPFETGEVVSAGARALQISGGKTKDAMKMVKLAEDMAAMNPGKTVSDAMEALADANVGEMERLKEFGLKASSKDDPKKVQGQLQDMYKGGAEKLANTGQGKVSTIMGKLKSNMADGGLEMVNAMKPALDGIIGFIDQSTPKMLEFGKQVGQAIGGVVTFITENFPQIKAVVEPIISSLGSIFSAVFPIIGQVIQALAPVFAGFLQGASFALQGVAGVVKVVAPVVSSLISALAPVFQIVGAALTVMGAVFKEIFASVQSVVKRAYDFIKPLIDGIGGMVKTVANGVTAVAGAITGKGKKKKNATGTRYFSGGVSLVGEHGPELVQMPKGSKVYTNRETNNMMNGGGSGIQINIASLTVKEEADVEKIAQKLVKKINENKAIYGGAY